MGPDRVNSRYMTSIGKSEPIYLEVHRRLCLFRLAVELFFWQVFLEVESAVKNA